MCRTYGETAAVLYYNNMACIHYAIGKPHLACFYMNKAVEENQKATEQMQMDDKGTFFFTINRTILQIFGIDKRYIIVNFLRNFVYTP